MTTLAKIAEQIKLLNFGHYQTGQGPHLEELKLLVAQAINSLFKIEKAKEIASLSDFNPSGMLMVTYDDQPVYEYKDRSAVKLPVHPINLPMGMGVWYVAPSNDIDNFFVPMITGQAGLTKTVKLLNNFENRVPYERVGSELIFSKNILSGENPVETVMMQLLVSDVSQLDEFDPLPIPPDMELPVIDMVLKLLGYRKPTETVNNPKDHD